MSSNGIAITLKCGVEILGYKNSTLKGQQFLAFQGIPYGEPPIGHLRFKPPVPKTWSTKSFDARNNEILCTQIDFFTQKLLGQEDCLVLNVYTQQVKHKRPVILFIHGGAYNGGCGVSHGPRKLLDQDIVFVTINYRVHVFGFLSTMDEACPGNFGLLDQIEALKWVQQNIEEFGGDPNCVTLMGQSAGAGSVMHLMLSPLAKGLFHRVILMSGNSLCKWALKSNPKYWAEKLARIAGCTSTDSKEIVEYLRTIPADTLTMLHKKLCEDVMIPMNPVVDGYVLPDNPYVLLQKGQIVNKVPVLMGVTKDEGLSFLPILTAVSKPLTSSQAIARAIAKSIVMEVEQMNEKVVELVRHEYFNAVDSADEKQVHSAIIQVFSDAAFSAAHYLTIDMLINAGIQPFLYSHDYVTEHSYSTLLKIDTVKGVGHSDDLYFLFDRENIFPQYSKTPNDKTEETFLQIWTYFAEKGFPAHLSHSGLVNWTPATKDQNLVYHLDESITTKIIDATYKKSKIDFWFKEIPQAINNSQ